MHDDMHQSDLVVKNVANITEAVSRLGKHAVVPSFTNYHAPSSHMFTRVQEANTALQIALKDVVAKCNTPECGSICMALDSSKVTVLGGDVVNLENNFVTFNSSGYRIFASELYDYVLGAAKRVEWAYWKQRLQAPK